MTPLSANVTRRVRNRVLTDGSKVKQVRYVLQYRDAHTSKRKQLFFERRDDALARRDQLALAVASGAALPSRDNLTVADAINHWLEHRKGEVKPGTWEGYLSNGAEGLTRIGVEELTTL